MARRKQPCAVQAIDDDGVGGPELPARKHRLHNLEALCHPVDATEQRRLVHVGRGRRGKAANVLDGPLSALRHLVGVLARDPVNSPLASGDIVTTGTLTRAFPILPGESWSTTLHGIELGGRPVWFA